MPSHWIEKKGRFLVAIEGEGLLAYAGPTKLERFYIVQPHLSHNPRPCLDPGNWKHGLSEHYTRYVHESRVSQYDLDVACRVRRRIVLLPTRNRNKKNWG